MPRKLTTAEVMHVRDHPGRVWRYHAGDLLVTVPLPPIAEHKQITRMRLAAGIAEAFHGNDPGLIGGYLKCAFEGDLLVIETGLTEREFGVVLMEGTE